MLPRVAAGGVMVVAVATDVENKMDNCGFLDAKNFAIVWLRSALERQWMWCSWMIWMTMRR